MAAPLKTLPVVDVAIAGGGLSGALIALRLSQRRPDVSVAMVDRQVTIGGNHTWSFHQTDISPAALEWVSPLVSYRWDSQSVLFPSHSRTFRQTYLSILSERLHEVASPILGDSVLGGREIVDLDQGSITLAGGETIRARAVIDARGDQRSSRIVLGFQKFLGQELRFAEPHGLAGPIIMDATVPQEDGYRFIYVLPFDDRTALVEDTRYADGAALVQDDLRRGVQTYCAGRGWKIEALLREEEGVLPIALAGDIEGFLDEGPPGVARAGMRAGLFHPLTGYSLPDAVALAEAISVSRDLSGPALHRLTRDHAVMRWRERGFYRMLCRFLFDAAEPHERYKVLQRFYRLSQPLIERFYAGVSPLRDQARILVGKPPVPVSRAIGCLDEARWRRSLV